MYLVEFVASEPRSGEIEMDLESVDTNEEARVVAVEFIERAHPTLEDIQIIGIKEI